MLWRCPFSQRQASFPFLFVALLGTVLLDEIMKV